MQIKISLLSFSLLMSFLIATAQDVRQYSFTHYGATEGLISNEGRAVVHDDDGFVWVATNTGVQRYDGSRFITLKSDKNNPRSLPHNMVHQMMKDSDRNIWVLCGDGQVAILNPRRMEFTPVSVNFRTNEALLVMKYFSKDDQGNVFLVALDTEYITWNKRSGAFHWENNPAPVPGNRKLLNITYEPARGKYWIATREGLVIYNPVSRVSSYAGHNAEQENIIEAIGNAGAYNLMFDRQGRLWYDVWGEGFPYLNCFNLKTGKHILYKYEFITQLQTYYETHGYMQQKDETIWVRGLGVFARYLEKENRFQMVYNGYINEQSIVYEEVSSFCEDNDENIWVTTTNNGLYRFTPSEQHFTNIRHTNRISQLPGKGGVLCFLQLPGGDLLASTWGDGIYRYDSALLLKPLNLPGIDEKAGPTVWNMILSHDKKRIWMGMQPGIGEYDLVHKKFISHQPPRLNNKTVRQIEKDREGNLWIGTNAYGAFKWDAEKGRRSFDEGISRIEEIPKATIGKIYPDSRGLVWITTVGHGVYVVDASTSHVLLHLPAKTPEGEHTRLAYSIHVMEYNDTTMIISGGTGLHVFNRITKNLQSIGNENTLSGGITSVEKDDENGYLWVSTTQGLYRVNIFNRIFVQFNRIDGISDDRFLSSASLKLSDGRMLFGANSQFTAFHPKDVRINNAAPPVSITGFRVFNRPLLVDSLLQFRRVELSPKQNSIAIDFSGLSYNGAYLIRYKLEGLDNDWLIADKSNQAVYTYLPPGNYTFMARSENADGRASVQITKLDIKVYPNFWQTWWFYGILLLVAAGILYRIDRERIRRMKELQRIRSEIANNLHADVTTTLSNINLLGEMAKIKADKDIDRSKEYIDQISVKSHNMIVAMDDILWSIDPENDSMEKTVLRMMEFTDALRNRYAANIELVVDKKVQSVPLNMKIRHEFFLVFKEGLRLIVQYAGGRNTLVQIDLFRQKLSLKLQDSTAHMDDNIEEMEAVIKQINDRTQALNGEADIQYDRNGIAVVVMVPAK